MTWDLEKKRAWQRELEIPPPAAIRELETVERQLSRVVKHLGKVKKYGQKIELPEEVKLLTDIAEESYEQLVGIHRKLRERLKSAKAIMTITVR